ncbi:hypothetical protein PGTUg99_001949 [Puccinia graminis f. sp. tritici]|uniref:Uncharacterized protein n=1 Tax=Puccinia graminis f. sp. tritici TaxID=56615 RepID=A0A5B0RE31_PUCGR|nr:hypothetical protein PGTUg99_001949 [Puccinia graminis f. sp. tritici]
MFHMHNAYLMCMHFPIFIHEIDSQPHDTSDFFPIFTNTGLSHEYLTRALPYYQLLHIFLESHPILNLVVKSYQ